MLKTIAVKQILPNPYRDMDNYPIQENKIEELQRSYTETGVWPTIVGRMFGNKLELAFGHHRWIAAQRAGIKEIPVNVLKLDDAQMIKMMVHENSEDWGSNALIDQEALHAALVAIAEGAVDISEFVPEDTNKRHLLVAPSVLPTAGGEYAPLTEGERVYTKVALARFLGWTRKHKRDATVPSRRFEIAWRSLQLIESGVLPRDAYKGLTREAAHASNQEASKEWDNWEEQQRRFETAAKTAEKKAASAETPIMKRHAELFAADMRRKALQAEQKKREQAAKVGEHVAKELRDGAGTRNAAQKAKEVKQPPKKQAPPPSVAELADRVAARVAEFLNDGDKLLQEVRAVIQYRGDCPPQEIKRLVGNLRKLATRCERLADQAEQPAEPTLTLIA